MSETPRETVAPVDGEGGTPAGRAAAPDLLSGCVLYVGVHAGVHVLGGLRGVFLACFSVVPRFDWLFASC